MNYKKLNHSQQIFLQVNNNNNNNNNSDALIEVLM
jgi:hypothetical protein